MKFWVDHKNGHVEYGTYAALRSAAMGFYAIPN